EGTGIIDVLDLPTLYGVYMTDAQKGVAAGIEGHVARTTDGGQRWAFDPLEVEYPLIDPLFRILELSNGDGWAVGAAGEGVRRQPRETKWKRAQPRQDGPPALRRLTLSDAQNT